MSIDETVQIPEAGLKPVSESKRSYSKFLPRALIAGVAMMAAAYVVPQAKADVILGTNGVQQSTYSIFNDTSRDGYQIECNLTWENLSDYVDANNQIVANGTFGSSIHLYDISTTDPFHNVFGTTYTINPESFLIEYASGVVNTPGNTDTFNFKFDLGENVTYEQAEGIVDNLNDYILGNKLHDGNDASFDYLRSINGEVVFDGSDFQPFENSPGVHVIPEPQYLELWLDMHQWMDQYSLYCLGWDEDGDGFDGYDEYFADTNPTNAASFLSLSLSGTNLTFTASSNCNYTVEWCDSLTSSNAWNVLTNDLEGVAGQMNISDSTVSSNRFYRVRAERK